MKVLRDIELPPSVIADVDQRTTVLNHWLDGLIEVAREERARNTPTELIVALACALTKMRRKKRKIGIDAIEDTLAMAIVRLAGVQDAAEGELWGS